MSRIGGRMVPAFAAFACLAMVAGMAHAGPGQLSADGCHKHKADQFRSWHKPGTHETGGWCGAKGEGPLPQTVEVDAAGYDALISERDGLRATLITVRADLANESARADRAERESVSARRTVADMERRHNTLMQEAEFDRKAAAQLHTDAKAVMAEAVARERGAGPKASRDCRIAVGNMLAASRWNLGDARARLRVACLE